MSDPETEADVVNRVKLRVPGWARIYLVAPWAFLLVTSLFSDQWWELGNQWAVSMGLACGSFALAQTFRLGGEAELLAMGFGLLLRVVNELCGSFANSWWNFGEGAVWFLVIFYSVTFVLPALIFCDCLHLRRQESRASEIPTPAIWRVRLKVPKFVGWVLVFLWPYLALAVLAGGGRLFGGSFAATSLGMAFVCFAWAEARFLRKKSALILMGIGLFLRSASELRWSVAKVWFSGGEAPDIGAALIFYLIPFILPALIFCDMLEDRRMRNRSAAADGL